jgi:hypothetical protein
MKNCDCATGCPLHDAAPLLFRALVELLMHADYLNDSGPVGQGWKSAQFMEALNHGHLAVLEAKK